MLVIHYLPDNIAVLLSIKDLLELDHHLLRYDLFYVLLLLDGLFFLFGLIVLREVGLVLLLRNGLGDHTQRLKYAPLLRAGSFTEEVKQDDIVEL